MSPKPNRKPHGEIRQSQLITTFGPGALPGVHAAARWIATGAADGAPEGCAGAVAGRDPARVVAEVRRATGL